MLENKFANPYNDLLQNNRCVYLFGQINNESSFKCITELMYLDTQGEDDILLYINSPGGNVSDGFAIIDILEHTSCKVITVCTGLCASIAALILASGHERWAFKNSEIMIHQPSAIFNGKVNDITVDARHLFAIHDKIGTHLSKKTGQSKEKILKDMTTNYYLSTMEALDYNMIDKII